MVSTLAPRRLRGAVGDHRQDVAQVYGEGLQVRVGETVWLLLLQVLGAVVHVNDAVLHLQLVGEVLGDALHGVGVLALVGEGPDIYRGQEEKEKSTSNTGTLLQNSFQLFLCLFLTWHPNLR